MKSNTSSHVTREDAEFFHSAVTSATNALKLNALITNMFRDKRDERYFTQNNTATNSWQPAPLWSQRACCRLTC